MLLPIPILMRLIRVASNVQEAKTLVWTWILNKLECELLLTCTYFVWQWHVDAGPCVFFLPHHHGAREYQSLSRDFHFQFFHLEGLKLTGDSTLQKMTKNQRKTKRKKNNRKRTTRCLDVFIGLAAPTSRDGFKGPLW